MTFRACSRCPTRAACAADFYAGQVLDCASRKGSPPVKAQQPNPEPPMTLEEAAGVVVRHWDVCGARGIEAAVTLLRRVLARSG